MHEIFVNNPNVLEIFVGASVVAWLFVIVCFVMVIMLWSSRKNAVRIHKKWKQDINDLQEKCQQLQNTLQDLNEQVALLEKKKSASVNLTQPIVKQTLMPQPEIIKPVLTRAQKLQPLVEEYNQILRLQGQNRSTHLTNFATKYKAKLIMVSNRVECSSNNNVPLNFQTANKAIGADYLLVDVPGEAAALAVLPYIKSSYEKTTHYDAGFERYFESNYEDGTTYSNLMVQEAAYVSADDFHKILAKGKILLSK